MSDSMAVLVVSLLAFSLLHAVWAVEDTSSPADCRSLRADVMWLLDESASLTNDDFRQVKDFVKHFAEKFNILPDGLNMGVATFHSSAQIEFYLNSYSKTADVVAAVETIGSWIRGFTDTEKGLELIRTDAFTEVHGDRGEVPNTLIVVTDGLSNNPQLTEEEAAKIHAMNVTVFAVGVGEADYHELTKLASLQQNVFQVQNFDGLGTLFGKVTGVVCEVTAALLSPNLTATLPPPTVSEISTPSPSDIIVVMSTASSSDTTLETSTASPSETAPDYYNGPASNQRPVPGNNQQPDRLSVAVDVMILLDNSGYMDPRDFYSVKELMKSFADGFIVGPNGLNMGVITFDRTSDFEFTLNSFDTILPLQSAIGRIARSGRDDPRMADALRRVREEAFTKANGDRPNAPNKVIVIADGRVADQAAVKDEAAELKKTNISIFVVTSFPQQVTEEMKAIASKEVNIFHVPDFDDVENIPFNLTEAVSEEIKALLPPTPAATPSTSDTPGPLHFHPQPPCMDSITSCAEYGFFDCNPDSLWAQYICRKHCGFCVQHCEYKGLWYSHGAQWQDGCAYDCECVDGATGHYQCYNKCPTYLFLPPHCTLVQLPGLCCLQPVCNFGAIYQTTTGQKVDNLNGYQVCVYNGTMYYQSQRWTVGCDMECFCYDAGVGLYTCHTKCAQYGRLPSNCRLVKKPDECCAKPECQFYTTMGPRIGVGQLRGNGQSVYTVFTF